MTGAREVETRKYILVKNILLSMFTKIKEMLPGRKILRKEGKIYNDWNAEVSRFERIYVASEYMKARDGAAEDTYEISLDIKRTDKMIDEYQKNLEEAQESLSQLNGIRAKVKKSNAKLMIAAINSDASLKRSSDEVAVSRRNLELLIKKKQIPMDPGTKLVKAEDRNPVEATYFRSLIGSLREWAHQCGTRQRRTTKSRYSNKGSTKIEVKKSNAKLMIAAINSDASLKRSRDEVAVSRRNLELFIRKKQDLYDQLKDVMQKFILELTGKWIVLTEEVLLTFHLEHNYEEANVLKAKYIQHLEKGLPSLESQLQGIKEKQRSSGRELRNVKRQVASLESQVEGLEQKVETLKKDLNDANSQRDADMENLSSCPPSPPIYKRMVDCHSEISVLQESRKTLTQKEDNIRRCISKMNNLIREHPWIPSNEHLFGIDGAYDYINEEPSTAWETCQELRIQKT
nr:ribonuclease H-like domain, reverse transcriptase, RNA-dependent DNA polymerase [Tanacetum cinerariifolium]